VPFSFAKTYERGLQVDWNAIKTEYITTDTSYRKLATKYNVSYTAIGNRSRQEGWVDQRNQFINKTVSKTINSISNKKADRLTRIFDASDKLLEKVERAIKELDIQLYKKVNKTKVIEYNNTERPDKPTKEIIEEIETVQEVSSIVDRAGLKAVTDALKNLKEVQMLRSELDLEEQRARIAKLNKDAQADDGAGVAPIKVVISDELSEYSK
jgi:hypothetical protein